MTTEEGDGVRASGDADLIATGPRLDAWQLLVDSASDAYVSVDAEGVVTRWNARACELFGWDRGEALGRLLADLIVPSEHRQAHLAGIRRFIETGQGEVVFQRLQLPALHRTGRRVDVEFTILPVEEHDTGWQFHAFLRDVTAELAGKRYVRLLERVAVAANEATAVETALRDTVQAVEELTGSRLVHAYLVEEGQDLRLVPTGWWSPAPVEPLRQVTAGSTLSLGEGLPGRVAASGEPAWIADIDSDADFPRAGAALSSGVRAAFAFPVMTENRPVAVIEVFLRELGEPDQYLLEVMRSVGTQLGRVFERQRATEELQRVAADREAIVSMVGHELLGPLGSAHTATALLAEQLTLGDAGHGTELLALLDRQLSRLRRMVDMFLSAQRLEAGSLKPELAQVALGPLAEQVVADGNFTDVTVTVGDDVRVLADLDHVAQMLWNLLSNATKHGTSPVRITAGRHGDTVTLSVADTGPGVPSELRPRLFERFARGPRSHGTGLGLSIVRGLARANGGDAAYLHDPATGPAFTIGLPAV